MGVTLPEHINTFCSLFKATEDVFVVRWEKSNKSDYMTDYQHNLYHYRMHIMNGRPFFKIHTNDNEIQKHLNSVHQIGTYPLHTDNISWFLGIRPY